MLHPADFPYTEFKHIPSSWGKINWIDIKILSRWTAEKKALELERKFPTSAFRTNNPLIDIHFYMKGGDPVQIYIRIVGIIEDFKSLWENLLIISEYIPEWLDFHFTGKRK